MAPPLVCILSDGFVALLSKATLSASLYSSRSRKVSLKWGLHLYEFMDDYQLLIRTEELIDTGRDGFSPENPLRQFHCSRCSHFPSFLSLFFYGKNFFHLPLPQKWKKGGKNLKELKGKRELKKGKNIFTSLIISTFLVTFQ